MPKNKLHTIDKVEIFAVGRWNGYSFSLEDLQFMATTFAELGERHKVPLKLGHDKDQPLTDGLFAIGWADKVWVENGKDGTPKLMARFVDVPDIVFKAVEMNMYRKVSIELDIDVRHKDKHYDFVLSGVALLGGELPAVNTLADISHYVMTKTVFSASKRLCFSALDVQDELDKEANMPISEEELERRLKLARDEEQAKFAREKQEAETKAQAELAAEKEKTAKFEREQKEREEAEAKNKIKLARETTTKVLDDAVKAMNITPAVRDSYAKMLGIDDDAKVVDIDIDELRTLVGEDKKKFSKDHAMGANNKDDEQFSGDASEQMDFKVQEYRDEHPNVSYSRALERVSQLNPKLAKDYMFATEEEEAA